MATEGQDSSTNHDSAAGAGTPDQPSAMPRMSPPTEMGIALPPNTPGRAGWAPRGRIACILLFWGVALALIITIADPILARLRESSRRTVCAANLKGIGTGFYTFANDDVGSLPILADHGVNDNPARDVDYVGSIGSYRGKGSAPNAGNVFEFQALPSKLSTTRGLWMLAHLKYCPQQAFICPSGDDAPNADEAPQTYWDFGTGDITGPATTAQVRQGWSQVSYGYQVPYGKLGQPSVNLDQRMAIAADKGPFGAAFDGGLPSPPPMTAAVSVSPAQWRPWNSPNHGGQGNGEGQNVLYADGRVDWCERPVTGVGYDNIYTQWSGDGSSIADRARGNPPTVGGKQTPAGRTDSLIYP